MSQCVTLAAHPAQAAGVVSVSVTDACCDLLELFGGVWDGRSDQGRDHPVAAVSSCSNSSPRVQGLALAGLVVHGHRGSDRV